MVPEQPQVDRGTASPSEGRPVRSKYRIRFRKAGDLRLVSHHDLMRCFERLLRRAAVPFHATEGFNPKPRMVFALSLPLGVIGLQEVVELELDADWTPEELRERLQQQAPPGLEFLSARRIERSLTGQVTRAIYRLPIPPERIPDLGPRIASLLASSACWVERTRPTVRRLDLRPWLRDVRLAAGALEMDFTVTPNGMPRPVEVLDLLGARDLIEAGGVLERTTLQLHDESAGATGFPQETRAAPVET